MVTSIVFLSFPLEIRRLIYRCLLFQNIPLASNPNSLHPNILRTCRQIHDEGREILYGENVLMVQVVLQTAPNYCFHEARLVCLADSEEVFKRFQKAKINIMCDDIEDVKTVQSDVRKVCGRLSQMKLRSLEISLDCRKPLEPGQARFLNYDRYGPKNRQSWEIHYPNGISKALRPFAQVRCLNVNVHGLQPEDTMYLKQKITSMVPTYLPDMRRRLVACLVDPIDVDGYLQDAVEEDDLSEFEKLRDGIVADLQRRIDDVYADDPTKAPDS
jgi:hypothetical protein